ncbi:dead end protein homolog 1 isoform 2-T2 [Leptosomus discolor]
MLLPHGWYLRVFRNVLRSLKRCWWKRVGCLGVPACLGSHDVTDHFSSALQPPLAVPVSWLSKALQASVGELLVSLCSARVAGLCHLGQPWTVGRVVLWMCTVERLLGFPEGGGVQCLLLRLLAGARTCRCFMGSGCPQLGGWKTLCSDERQHHLLPQMWTNGINQANKMALRAWTKETGISLVQINGQRRYGGPPRGWVGDPPPAGTEVFIGKLPQDMYENVLIPLFQSVGKLYEFRLMMTFSGLNRGFAYAKYSSRRDAKEAMAALNNFEVREGCAIVVCKSVEKCELSVDGLATSVSQQELEAVLRQATEGVLSVTLYTSPCQKQAQLAVLKYGSHQAAAKAKKTLVEGNVRLGRVEMRVDWLKPDLKQKLQSCKEKPSSSQVQRGNCPGVPKQPPLFPAPSNVLDCLNALCRRRFLGTPLFLTKCVRANPDGWLQFWCRVVIPGCPVPFSGFTWVRQDGPGGSGHEKAKVAAALQVLWMLGCQQT